MNSSDSLGVVERLERENQQLRAELGQYGQKEIEWQRVRDEFNATLHDLSVHQEELRTQNEDLRVAHHDLDLARKKYLDLYDFAPVGYLTIDRNGVIKDLNFTAAKYLGREKNRIIGKPWALNLPETHREILRAHLREVFDGYPSSTEVQFNGQHHDTEPLYALLESAPTFGDDGMVTECRTAVLDISERKKAEEARAASERKYRSLVEHMNEGLVLWQKIGEDEGEATDWVVKEVNTAFELLTGITRGTSFGKSIRLVYGSLWGDEKYRKAFSSVVETGKPMQYTEYLPAMQKHLSFSMFSPAKGMVAVVVNDVTEQKRAEEAKQKHLSTLGQLIELTVQILSETTQEAVLAQSVDASRKVTHAMFGAALHGLGAGDATVRISSAEEVQACPPEGVLTEEITRQYLDLMGNSGSVHVRSDDVQNNAFCVKLGAAGLPDRGVLATRLVDRQGLPAGVIIVCDKENGAFTAEDEAVLKQLAALASLGLQHILARDKAEQRAEEMEAVFSSLTDAVFVYDTDGVVMNNNKAASSVCGFDPVGKKAPELLQELSLRPEDIDPNTEIPSLRALRGETVTGVRLDLKRYDGSELVVLDSACPVLLAGKTIGAVAVWHDVTERENLFNEVVNQKDALRRANDQLEVKVRERTADLASANEALRVEVAARLAAEQELRRSNASLQQFAFVASHDLQEPLRKILAFGGRLEQVLSSQLTEQTRDYLRRMQKATQRMQTLIEDLLTYSRVSNRSGPFRAVDLNRVVKGVLSDLESSLEATGCLVEVGELPTIEADHTQMRQLFQNLVSNAIKFRGHTKPLVKIYAEPTDTGHKEQRAATADKGYRIFVEDNGIGFDERHAEKIFQLFERLHGRSDYEGTGMGLAICKKIVDSHGGTLTAKSQPERGATFIVTLPAQQAKWTPESM